MKNFQDYHPVITFYRTPSFIEKIKKYRHISDRDPSLFKACHVCLTQSYIFYYIKGHRIHDSITSKWSRRDLVNYYELMHPTPEIIAEFCSKECCQRWTMRNNHLRDQFYQAQ